MDNIEDQFAEMRKRLEVLEGMMVPMWDRAVEHLSAEENDGPEPVKGILINEPVERTVIGMDDNGVPIDNVEEWIGYLCKKMEIPYRIYVNPDYRRALAALRAMEPCSNREQSGLTVPFVSRLLNAPKPPDAKTLAAIATGFDVELCELLCPVKKPKKRKDQ